MRKSRSINEALGIVEDIIKPEINAGDVIESELTLEMSEPIVNPEIDCEAVHRRSVQNNW